MSTEHEDELQRRESLKWGFEVRQRVLAAFKREALSDRRLAAAQRRAKLTGETLWEALLGLSAIGDVALADAFAHETGLPRWTTADTPDPAATALVPVDFCRRQRLAPLRLDLEQLVVAMADPSQRVALDRIELMTGRATRPLVGTFRDVSAALDRAAGLDGPSPPVPRALVAALDEAVSLPARPRATSISANDDDAPVAVLVGTILRRALERRATEVVVEPVGHELRVLLRGTAGLQLEMTPPKKAEPAIVNRLKVLAGLDISERKVSQTGRMLLAVDGRLAPPMHVRTVPTRDGELVHVTWLRPDLARAPLADLGFEPGALAAYEHAIARPGLVLIVGPPGSGKRTLGCATLAAVARAGRPCASVDEVIEHELPGVLQLERGARPLAAAVDEALAHAPALLALDALYGDAVARRVVACVREGRTVLLRAPGRDAASALAAAGLSPALARAVEAGLALTVRPSVEPPAQAGAAARGRYAVERRGAP